MFSERLSALYTSLEEKYYGVLDFLDKRGVPVYSYNDFIENRGLPAFPVTVALIVLIVAAIYGVVFISGSASPHVSFSFVDQFGESVSRVTITAKDAGGKQLSNPETVSSGESILLQNIPLGSEIVLLAEKQGFEPAEKTIVVKGNELSASFELERQVVAITGMMQLLDSDTRDPVRGALVTVEWQGTVKSETSNAEGKVSFVGIPENMDVLVTVQADGYETLSGNYSFFGNELKELTLAGSSISLSGTSKLIVSVEDIEGEPVKGAKIIVMDRETDTSIEERTVGESEAVFTIPKKTSVRLIVQKEGFLNYDSLDLEESRTMRLDEERWPVVLAKGGTRLVVTVFAAQTPLSDATVQLYDLNNNFVEYGVTGFGGTTEFAGLSPKEYYVTGYKLGYLPARQVVDVASNETASITLESADGTNSAYLGITVLDSYRAMANGADLKFWERQQEKVMPLGIPSLKTDVSGYASIKAMTGTVVVVEAEKELQTGTGEKLIEANKENQLVIELSKPIDVVELQIVDSEGKPVSGTVRIESVAGELLYEGPITNGSVFFDSEGNKEVIVTVETDSGETFSQRVNIEGKETAKINLGEAASGMAPTIKFTGVFNELGESVEGITPGKDYWLGFEASWASGLEKGGVHVRIGNDSVAFVDSEEAGITGFEATTTKFLYGKSYQPLPSPGNETADKQNIGMAGEYSKFLELYFEEPTDSTAFRVKVRAREAITKEEIEVHYRAWAEAGGKHFRNPVDSELGEELFTPTKTALYASAEKAAVKVFLSDATCAQDLCANYFFVMPDGLYVERQDFKAVTEELYALEIDLSSKKELNVTLKLDTDKVAPKIKFTGYEVDNFADQQQQEPLDAGTDISGQGYIEFAPGSGEAQLSSNPLGFKQGTESTSLTITGLGVSPDRSRKVRVYFKGIEEGKAEIKLQAVGETVLNESFVFNVERNKELLLSVVPSEISVGEAFTVRVTDAEDGSGIQEATVQVKDKDGGIALSIAGRGSTGKGLDGEYYFRNSLKPGIYTIVAMAEGYKSAELEVTIAKDGILTMKSPVKIDISRESREKTVSLGIHNTGKEEVKELGYEIEKDDDFPEEFTVDVTMPLSIAGSQDGTASIRVTVNLDEESAEDLYGEAKLIVKGMVAGNYPTKTESVLQISYNKKLDEACLRFDRQQLMVKLIGRAGSTAVEEITVENKCETALNLRATVEGGQQDPNIYISVPPLTLEKDAIEKIQVTVTNRIERMYAMQNRFDYKIKFESGQIAKTLPLSVELWNPMANLSYPPNVALWMVRAAMQEMQRQGEGMANVQGAGMAYAQAPLQIYNNSAVPVTAFRAAVTSEAYEAGISVGILPRGIDSITLPPQSPLTPQHFVYAETSKTEAMIKPGQGWIQYTGVIAGRQYPDLGRTMFSVNYSGTKCLKAEAIDSLVFSSREAGEGTLERLVKVKNECGEPVRLTGKVKPDKIGGNEFVVSPSGIVTGLSQMAPTSTDATLGPGQEMNVKLILLKRQEANRSAVLKIVGLLTMQNQWIESNELNVQLKLGELAATTDGKATSKISIKKCDSGETKEIAFPLVSSDCGQGYCDAKQLAEYLTAKMDTMAKSALDKIKRAKNSADAFSGCAQKEFCSFEEMGILDERFPVYMQLDFMTTEVLVKALKDKSKTELKSYDAKAGEKSVEDIGKVGFGVGNINIGGVFKGCGKYYARIVGAARVQNREVLVDDSGRNFLISLNVEQPRATTDECLHRIENTVNFLPIDESYTLKMNYHAWPGFVRAAGEFEALGKEFAKELFGKPEDRYSATVQGNVLDIVKGGFESGLIKIQISKEGKPDEQKTITVHIPSNYSKDNKTMNTEIAKAFASFRKNAFSEGDCWGEDASGQYILMKSYSDVDKLYGKLEISGDKKIPMSNQLQCSDFNVSSKVAENVWLETDFLQEGKNPSKDGIEFVKILDSAGKEVLAEMANGTRPVQKKETQLKKKEEKPGQEVYTAAFKLCVKGNEKFANAVENVKTISITAKSNIIPARQTEPLKVSLEACGMHPYDLVKKMGEVTLADIEKKPDKKIAAYVTVGWSGSPEEVDISMVQRALAAELAAEQLRKEPGYVPGSNLNVAEQPAHLAALANQRLTGILAYFVPCAVTSAVYGFIMHFGWGALLDVTLDCAVPALWAAKEPLKDAGGTGKAIVESIESFARRFIPFLGEWLFPENKSAPASGPPTQAEINQKVEETHDTLLKTAILGVSADSVRLAVKNGGAVISPGGAGFAGSARVAGEQVAETVFEQLKKTSLKDLQTAAAAGDTAARNLLLNMQEKFAGKVTDNLLTMNATNPKAYKFVDDAIVAASQSAAKDFAGEVSGDVIANASKFGRAANTFKDAGKKVVDEIVKEDAFVRTGGSGISKELVERSNYPSGGQTLSDIRSRAVLDVDSFKSSALDTFERNVKDTLKTQLGNNPAGTPIFDDLYTRNPAFRTAVDDAITNGKSAITIDSPINGIVDKKGKVIGYKHSAKITSNIDDATRRTVAGLKSGPAAKAIAENIDSAAKKVANEFGQKLIGGDATRGLAPIADDLIDPKGATAIIKNGKVVGHTYDAGRLSRLGENLKNWRRFVNLETFKNLFKNLAKGVAGGIIANWVGFQGWKWYWEGKLNAQPAGQNRVVVNPTTTPPTPTAGPQVKNPIEQITGKPLLASQALEKGATYRLEITGDEEGKLFKFTKVQGDAGLETMKKELADKKAELWEEKGCTNFRTKKVEKALGNLAPMPSKQLVSEQGLAYYRYNYAFAKAGEGDSSTPGDNVYEDEIAAILFVQPEKIPNCGIGTGWFKRGQGETIENAQKRAEDAIACAGKELRAAKTRAGGSFETNFENAVKVFSPDKAYADPVVAAQKLWKTFRVLRAA